MESLDIKIKKAKKCIIGISILTVLYFLSTINILYKVVINNNIELKNELWGCIVGCIFCVIALCVYINKKDTYNNIKNGTLTENELLMYKLGDPKFYKFIEDYNKANNIVYDFTGENNTEIFNNKIDFNNIIKNKVNTENKIKTTKKTIEYNKPTLELLKDNTFNTNINNSFESKIDKVLELLNIDVVSKEVKDSRIATTYIYKYSNLMLLQNTFNKLTQALKCFDENIVLNKHYAENTLAIECIKVGEDRYVNIKEVIKENNKMELPLYLGINTDNKNSLLDLAKAPHILIGGQTGGGKSVAISTIITSLIYNKTPEELDLYLIDKKRELSLFNSLPHLKSDCLSDDESIVDTLFNIEYQMRERSKIITKAGCRNIKEYNQKNENKMSYIVCIIDELQDLYNKDIKKDTEYLLNTIASMGRASGVHLIVATQRPSAKLLSGELKANLPTKIAFATSNATDSRVILDSNGAERLAGNGDALLKRKESIKLERLQIANITIDEIQGILEHINQ